MASTAPRRPGDAAGLLRNPRRPVTRRLSSKQSVPSTGRPVERDAPTVRPSAYAHTLPDTLRPHLEASSRTVCCAGSTRDAEFAERMCDHALRKRDPGNISDQTRRLDKRRRPASVQTFCMYAPARPLARSRFPANPTVDECAQSMAGRESPARAGGGAHTRTIFVYYGMLDRLDSARRAGPRAWAARQDTLREGPRAPTEGSGKTAVTARTGWRRRAD